MTWPSASWAGPATDRLAEDLSRFLPCTGVRGGSNNWVVDGSRTATGRPLLANDPHLGASAPRHFYLAHLRCPQWEAAGASLVGRFGIFAGHNDAGARGATNGMVDNTDLCVEELGPGGGTVQRCDTFVPCKVVAETIRVKGPDPLTERVLLTPEGPVIGPALDGGRQRSPCARRGSSPGPSADWWSSRSFARPRTSSTKAYWSAHKGVLRDLGARAHGGVAR